MEKKTNLQNPYLNTLQMPPRRYHDPAKRSVPAEFRAILEEGYDLTGDPAHTALTWEIKEFILARRPEWAVFSPAWWSINLTKNGVGNARKHYPVRTGLLRRQLP